MLPFQKRNDIESRKDYLRSLELDTLQILPLSVLPTAGKPDGYVDNGSVASFVGNLSGQNKNDVLYSCLLAQLAARAEHDPDDDPEGWYKKFSEVMETVGWVIQSFDFKEYKSELAYFSLQDVTLEIAKQEMSREVARMLQQTLDALHEDPKGFSLFSSNSTKQKAGHCMILPCTADASGQIIATFIGFHFKGNRKVDDFLFTEWGSEDIHLWYGTQTCTLNEDLYSQLRGTIINKLGDNAKKNILKLKLPNEGYY